MFKIDWRTTLTVGLTLISAFAIAGYILGHQLGEETGKKDAHTKEYERHAADEIERTCLSLDPKAEAECVVRVINSAHEHKRAESDLIAQRNMARWALLMLLATIAMAFITAGGVYYVWRTLKVTREIGEAQVRAYVDLEVQSCAFRPVQNEDGSNFAVIFKCIISNCGNSPAFGVEVLYTIEVVGKTDIIGYSSDGSDFNPSGRSTSTLTSGNPVPYELTRTFTVDQNRIASGEDKFRFAYVIQYVDVFAELNTMPMVSGNIHINKDGEMMFISDKFVDDPNTA